MLANAILMYELRESLLSHATLSSNQDAYIGRGDEQSHFYRTSEPCRVPHNPKPALGFSYFVAVFIHIYIIPVLSYLVFLKGTSF